VAAGGVARVLPEDVPLPSGPPGPEAMVFGLFGSRRAARPVVAAPAKA